MYYWEPWFLNILKSFRNRFSEIGNLFAMREAVYQNGLSYKDPEIIKINKRTLELIDEDLKRRGYNVEQLNSQQKE